MEVNLVTALVPSETACLASSPGRMRRTAVSSAFQLQHIAFCDSSSHSTARRGVLQTYQKPPAAAARSHDAPQRRN